jgi:hypothetical protein
VYCRCQRWVTGCYGFWTAVQVHKFADFRVSTGHLRTLNELAKKANADYILHTGDFGFYDETSLDRIADKFVTPRCSMRCY